MSRGSTRSEAPLLHRISQFRLAFELMPLTGPGQINAKVRGPAYVYAILTDPRITT